MSRYKLMEFDTPDVLVLGGGGILGEAWMNALLVGLQEATGFDPRGCRHFVGTSAGAIVAAGLAGGVDPRTRLDELPEQPPAGETARAGGGRFGRGVGALAPLAAVALRSRAVGGAAVRRAALSRVPTGKRSLGGLAAGINRLGVGWDGRLRITTVEVETGRRVVFGEDGIDFMPVGRAVEASCAIPAVFRPVRAGARTYVDGGVWSLTNLDVAPVERGTRVLCLNPTGALPGGTSLRGAMGPWSRSVAAVEALALERRGANVDNVSPDPDAARVMGINFMNPSRRSATAEAGYAQGLRLGRQLAAAA